MISQFGPRSQIPTNVTIANPHNPHVNNAIADMRVELVFISIINDQITYSSVSIVPGLISIFIRKGHRLETPEKPRVIITVMVIMIENTVEIPDMYLPCLPENQNPGLLCSRSRNGIKNNPRSVMIGINTPPEKAEYETNS